MCILPTHYQVLKCEKKPCFLTNPYYLCFHIDLASKIHIKCFCTVSKLTALLEYFDLLRKFRTVVVYVKFFVNKTQVMVLYKYFTLMMVISNYVTSCCLQEEFKVTDAVMAY